MKFDPMVCADHLAGMIHFKTVSDKNPENVDYSEFEGLHRYLEETYPLIHKTLSREIIGSAGLLYCWKGTGKSSNLPIMFMAHQDVVPAGDESRWTYPPFSGTIADGHIWGRGANDCKCVMLAHFEAIEALLAEGFTPDYDVYLAYGCTEEIGGDNAAEICNELARRGIRLGMIIDEGSGACPGVRAGMSGSYVEVKTAEKGSGSFKITVSGQGGHTMNMNGAKSLIARMGQVTVDLENNPFPWRMTDCVADEMRARAPYMLDEKDRENFADPWEKLDGIVDTMKTNGKDSGKLQNSMSLMNIKSFPEAGSMPTDVELSVSSRLLQGDTKESAAAYLQSVVGDRGAVEVTGGCDPSPVSRIDTGAYDCVKAAYETLYPGIHVIPALGVGGTDARNYYPVCDCVYRCSGYPYSTDHMNINIHDFNENMQVEILGQGPEFFVQILETYADYPNEA